MLDEREQQSVFDEIRLMKESPHPLIVKIIDDFLDYGGHQCIVQDFFSEGDFSKFLSERSDKKFEEEEILRFLANIIMTVSHINSRDIYHRDLKPGNFLIKTERNGRVYLYLNDFGIAKKMKPDYTRLTSSAGVVKGTVEYLPPEILV